MVPLGTSVPGKTTICVPHPKLAFIRAAEALRPPVPPRGIEEVHPTAIVSPEAALASGVCVGPYAVIERGVRVGGGCSVGAGVYLGEGVELGGGCVLHPRVTIYPGVSIGNRVIIHSGAVLGSDGFGYVFAEGRQQKFPQVGKLVVGDDVEIGANTTVFTLAKAFFLESVPVKDPARVVSLYSNATSRKGPPQEYLPTPYLNAVDYREKTDVFSGSSIAIPAGLKLVVSGKEQQVFGELVNGNLFDVLGIDQRHGFGFSAADR